MLNAMKLFIFVIVVVVVVVVVVQFDNGSQPACFTRDICLKIHGRDSRPTPPRSLLSFITGQKPGPDE